MARTGLGRGLDVLLGSAPAQPLAALTPSTSEIPLEKIQPNRQQPRQHFDQESIQELARSIAAHGVLQAAIGRELKLKRTPQLTFEYDPSVEQGVRMTKLIDDLAPQSVDTEHDEPADDDH